MWVTTRVDVRVCISQYKACIRLSTRATARIIRSEVRHTSLGGVEAVLRGSVLQNVC